jgi:hypothetical protein
VGAAAGIELDPSSNRLSEATATAAFSICRARLGRGADRIQIRPELGTFRCNCVVLPFDNFAIAQEEHADPVPRLETEILEMVDALVENHRPAGKCIEYFESDHVVQKPVDLVADG